MSTMAVILRNGGHKFSIPSFKEAEVSIMVIFKDGGMEVQYYLQHDW